MDKGKRKSVRAQFSGCCANCGRTFYAGDPIYIVNQTIAIQSGIHKECKDEWNKRFTKGYQQVR